MLSRRGWSRATPVIAQMMTTSLSHDHEAGSSSSALPAPQIDPALLAILEQMRQDQAHQAQETAATFAQSQARQDEF